MKKALAVLMIPLLAGVALSANAGPEEDRVAFEKYFHAKFPKTPPEDFINGVYSIHAASREQWEEIEEFPPYELAIDEGEELFNKPFKNGKTYASCFENGGENVRKNYPYFDEKKGEVVTLELAINRCREANGEKKLKYKKGKMAAISAYMAYSSRGEKIAMKPPTSPAAMAAYDEGKQFFYTKRGQLNFSCMDCHGGGSGKRVRADTLSPALGHVSHFPVYRSKWGGMGTLHRRFAGCNTNIRAKALKAQGKEYRNLEYFLTYMSNGLEFNGPGARK